MNTVLDSLKDPLIQKLLITVFVIIVAFVVLLFLRRFLRRRQLPSQKQLQAFRWILYTVLILCCFIFIRIWTGTRILSSFENQTAGNFIKSAVVLGAVYLILYFIRRFINSLQISLTKKHEYRKRAGYISTIIFLLLLVPIWAGHWGNWVTVLSVMGAGIALALHEVLLNFAAWIYIIIRHPYRTGDRIELAGLSGDVIDIRVLQSTLLEIGNWVDGDQSTGRVVHVPNGQIFRQPLYNYTQGFEFIWNEFSVLLTFESNWESAKAIMLQFGEELSQEVQETMRKKIDRMAREYLIYYKNFSPIVYVSIQDSGIKLTLRYLTETKKRRSGINTLSEKLLKAFSAESDIEFAYPTYRIYRRGEEKTPPSQ